MLARIVFLIGLGMITATLAVLLLVPFYQQTEPEARVIPADAFAMDDIAQVISSIYPPTPNQWAWLETLARAGDPVAQNNLGVALSRSHIPPVEETPEHWFRLAATQKNIQARYNLAMDMPDRQNTDTAIVTEAITLLEANVALGDVPSMVALADRLHFANREAMVPNREALRRDLLAQAAASGDPDYLLRAGRTFWNDVRGSADPMLLLEAFGYLEAAFAAGDPRGAEIIGDIMANSDPALKPAKDASGLSRNPLVWLEQAAGMGLASAQCRYGLEMFQTLRWHSIADEDGFSLFLRQYLVEQGYDLADLSRGRANLADCVTATRNQSGPNRPFGSPALYASKIRPTWTSLANSPAHAAMTLGVLHGYGITVERDLATAERYLLIARDGLEVSEAQDLLDRIGL